MKTTFTLPALSVVAFSTAVTGCGGPVADVSMTANDIVGIQEGVTSRIHIMPLRDASAPAPAVDRFASGHKLTYYGGPVLKSVQVYPIHWGAGTIRCASNIDSGYGTIVASSIYTSLLPQYSSIGTGTSHASYTDSGASGTNLTDTQIQAELTRLFKANAIPQPGANNYYPVHFPSGTRITSSDGSQSCVQFCAYHGTYVYNGTNVNYGVIPDVGDPGCAGGCGAASQCNNTTSVMSHELVEATTDPAVGLATVYGPPLAWYNATYGEIGDECNAQQATVSGITMQKEWSNSKNACATN
jgi:hypothetical protein